MKAIFIAFDQAYFERIIEMLHKSGCRGFTSFNSVTGRGSSTGVPHYGTHAWPSLVQGILTIVDANRVDNVLEKLHEMDLATPKLGLRAFVWNIEKSI